MRKLTLIAQNLLKLKVSPRNVRLENVFRVKYGARNSFVRLGTVQWISSVVSY